MKRIVTAPLFLAAALFSAAAVAAPECTKAPQDQWMSKDKMKQQILDQGYTIKVFKISGNCYEICREATTGKNAESECGPTDGRTGKRRWSGTLRKKSGRAGQGWPRPAGVKRQPRLSTAPEGGPP